MNKTLLIVSSVVIVILVIVAIVTQSDDESITGVSWPSGMVSTSESTSHDWGDINIDGGDVEHVFTLHNKSEDPLIIKTASTSCMCTTAYIDVSDESTPRQFGMHNNPVNWNGLVKPGDDFTVRVVFDPMAHGPNAVGPIQRSIFLFTSYPPDGQTTVASTKVSNGSLLELRVTGDVLYKQDYIKKATSDSASYSETIGDFAFTETEFDFGIVKQSAGIQTHAYPFIYTGKESIMITSVVGSCACTTGEVNIPEPQTGDKGLLTVSFDPNLHEEPEGKFFKTVSLLTDPLLENPPEVKIWVEMDLDLGPEAYKLQEAHEE